MIHIHNPSGKLGLWLSIFKNPRWRHPGGEIEIGQKVNLEVPVLS